MDGGGASAARAYSAAVPTRCGAAALTPGGRSGNFFSWGSRRRQRADDLACRHLVDPGDGTLRAGITGDGSVQVRGAAARNADRADLTARPGSAAVI
ncbi:MAG: hypothetical protein MZW92_60280 [Comamonadaceae bacterium]|nr:hypothetical protein [Comamonadaceae bacterium]